jgi:hypothetical protein
VRAAGWLRSVCSAVALLVASRASAAGAVQDVDFRAQRMELDPSLGRLRLSGHVAVWVGRYHLSSERLELFLEQRSVRVEGPADLAFCPCSSPPLTVRFTSAQLSPGEAIVKNPTLRAFGVPVLWLPALWLRAPSEWGLLPLELAYRGDDGLLLGSGVHVPLGESGLDLSGAGYVRGGADASARFTTERTSSFVRWDHRGDTALAVDLRGSTSPGAQASLAWSADALRGARALRGPSLLEEVALRQDRARAAAGFSSGGATAGVAVEADAPRGAPLGAAATVGPELSVAFGAPLGASATANIDLGVATFTRPSAATESVVSERAEVRGTVRAGPIAMDLEGRARAFATLDELGAGYTAAAAVTGELSAPFVKELGTVSSPLEHWITPFVSGRAGGVDTRAPSAVPAIAPDGAFFVLAGGVRSTFGERAGARAAVSASVEGGYAGDGASRRVPVLAWRAAGRASAIALRGEGVSSWDEGGPGSVVLSALRVGREDSLFVEGRVEGMSGPVPLLARMVSSGFDAPWFPWLEEPGWSVGGRLGMPWTRFLASSADVAYDATNGALLGIRGGITYHHPCECLSATAWAGHRAGREGADGFVTLSLSPRGW